MLATAVTQLPSEPGWAFEFKWDGVRALIDVSEQGVAIRSRAGNEITTAYPELSALAREAGDALLDGEIVAFVAGLPSFERLQTRMHVRSAAEAQRLAADAPVTFVAFDLLRRYGVDLSGRPYAMLDLRFRGERIGELSTQMVPHALESFVRTSGMTLHLRARGQNDHHIAEAAFKALARAVRAAVAIDPRRQGVPSTKGSLG